MPENKKIQITIDQDIWPTAEELGDEIKRQDPARYGHRDSYELGTRAAKSKPNLRIVPLEWGDVSGRKVFSNFPEDFIPSAKEGVEGMYEFAKAPIESAQGLGAAASLLHEEVAAPKMRSILNSITGIDMSGFPTVAGPGHEPLGSRVDPESKEAIRAAGKEFREQTFTPAGVQGRPARALSNWRAITAPLTGAVGAGKKARQFLGKKGLPKVNPIDLLDPSTAPLVALGSLVKGPVRAAQWTTGKAKKLTDKGFQAVGKIISDRKLSSEATPLWLEVLSSTYGFTTSKGQEFMQAMYDYGQKKVKTRTGGGISAEDGGWAKTTPGGEISAEDMIRDVRHMNRDRAADLLLTRSLEMINDYKKQMDEDFAQAKTELSLGEDVEIAQLKSSRGPRGEQFDSPQPRGISTETGFIDTQSLKKQALRVLRKNFGVRQKGTFGKETTISSQGDPVVTEFSTGEGQLFFPEFGKAPRGQTTAISRVGNGQAMVRELYESLINARPDGSPVTVEELWNFRRTLDDAIGMAGAEHSNEARKALSDLRFLVHKELKKVPGFSETMDEWEAASLLLERAEKELGLKPGKLTKNGEIRDINREETLNSLTNSLGSDSADALKRQTLEALQEATGNETIIPTILGVGANDMAGRSLAAHSKFADLGRGVMAMGLVFGGLKTAVLAIPALTIFSPRFVSEMALELASRVKGEKATFARTQAFMKRAEEAHRKAVELNNSTGGQLAKIATREGWTLGQMFERLQIETGVEIEGTALKKPPTTLENLSKIDPTAGMGLQKSH